MSITEQEINDAYAELKNCQEEYGEVLKKMAEVKETKTDIEAVLHFHNAVQGSNDTKREGYLRMIIPGNFIDLAYYNQRFYDVKTALEVAQAEVARVEALLHYNFPPRN